MADGFGLNYKDFNEIFSQNLRNLMYKRDITQRQLANQIGVSSTIVSDWYNGKKTPRMDKIDLICRALNCDRSDLMFETINEKPVEIKPDISFTPDDYRLIIKIMQLDGAGRTLVDLVVDHELERVRATKKDTKGAD